MESLYRFFEGGESPMSMPTIPEGKHRPNFNEVIIDLLESIALEEMAISHLINAEAEKVQAFVGKDLNFPTCPTNREINLFNHEVHKLVDRIVMKEWLLLRKLEDVINLMVSTNVCEDECKDDCEFEFD